MHRLRSLQRLKQLLAALMLLSLLLQLETVFTCHMMAFSGPLKHCCCSELKAAHEHSPHSGTGQKPCCDFDAELSLNDSVADSDSPATITPGFSLQILYLGALLGLLTLFLCAFSKSVPVPLPDQRARPGNYTWLYTLRLRI